MAITAYSNMQVVPEKFTSYTLDRTTSLSTLVRSGIATADNIAAQLINGLPAGGRFITMPHFDALAGDDDVFSETALTPTNITTGSCTATILMRQKAWGATDLSHVLGGADPMAAIGNLVADWWLEKEQAIYLSILKGLLDPTSGCLKSHVNDISAKSNEAAYISVGAALDTKQTLGDHASSLGMVFMHSATYTYLQKNQQIVTEYDSDLKINIQFYLGYRVVVDDGMPWIGYTVAQSSDSDAIAVTTSNIGAIQPHCATTLTAGTSYVTKDAAATYTTYFLGSGALIRQDGTPAGFVGTETDRDKLAASDYLINRRCMVIHPRGCSWNVNATYPNGLYYPNNAMLATPANWTLTTDAKKVPIAALVHKIG